MILFGLGFLTGIAACVLSAYPQGYLEEMRRQRRLSGGWAAPAEPMYDPHNFEDD